MYVSENVSERIVPTPGYIPKKNFLRENYSNLYCNRNFRIAGEETTDT
jgi:hypothetical protein